jgi:nicotinamidase-related amidase
VAGKRQSQGTALVVLDMLNSYEHDEGEELAKGVAAAIDGVRTIIDRAHEAEIPVIYVNDNYGDWNSSSEELAAQAMAGAHPELVEPVLPREGDSFVIKARHNAFYETPLEYLLGQTRVDRIVFAGQVTEQCVFYSALDAYVRHFRPVIATDAVAAIYEDLAAAALQMMERNMGAELGQAAELELS